jgi:predicted ATPase
MKKAIFLKKVILQNYKSIKSCSVQLGPLTFLVGPNGAGKSNFLDALRLTSESLHTSLDHALRERGGINEVRRRSTGHPTHFGIRIEFQLPGVADGFGFYAFRVGARPNGGYEVQMEKCALFDRQWSRFEVESGLLKDSSFPVGPSAAADRLYLVAASGLPEFRPVYDALSHMGFYNLNPDEIRDLQPADTGELLRRDGSNLASVLNTIAKENKEARNRVIEFLSKVVPGIEDVTVRHVGKKETLEFRQQVGSNREPWRFLAENMSDGTLRALGVLTALFQSGDSGAKRVPFVGIEEPEAAVHPGAAGVLRDGLQAASRTTQVAVTSHSPDLLDDKDITDDAILVVENRNGDTVIGPMDDAGRSAIRDRLYTAGELLRSKALSPDEAMIEKAALNQPGLFADETP